MRWTRADGTPGLLQQELVHKEAPKLPELDLSGVNDSRVWQALYRDYSFIVSTYLFEDIHHGLLKTGNYPEGKNYRIPANLAVPLKQTADLVDLYPFLEYSSYALYNYKKKNPAGNLDIENLDAIRMFEGTPDENGFILAHVGMVQYSGDMVKFTLDLLEAAERGDRKAFDESLKNHLINMKKINKEMDKMWKNAQPSSYARFRTFIFGIKDQSFFPNGVFMEGV